MTANEMKFSFQLKFDSLFEFSAPAYDDRQISYLLTEAQFRVFTDHYDPLSNKTQRGFESNEMRRRDLEQFIKSASVSGGEITASSDQTGIHTNGTFYDLPTDFLYAVEENAITTAVAGEEVNVKPVKHDEYRANIRNPYKQPYENLVWRMDYSRYTPHYNPSNPATPKRTELIVGPNSSNHSSPGVVPSITDYRVRYIQMPPDIVVDEVTAANQRHCVLDETLHRVIVDEAVKMAVATVNPEEYQLKVAEKTESET